MAESGSSFSITSYLLFLRLDEFVVLHRHLAAQSLTGVRCRAVSVDDVGSWKSVDIMNGTSHLFFSNKYEVATR